MSFKKFTSIFLTLILLVACSHDPLQVDSSKIRVNIEMYNMDSIFVNSSPKELLVQHRKFEKEIQDAYYYVLGRCLRISAPQDTIIIGGIQNFRTDPYIAKLEKTIAVKFAGISSKHQLIEDGFRNLKFHFPKMRLPKSIVYANCLFESSAFATENDLVMGLERYIGEKNPLIDQLPGDVFFNWVKKGMDMRYFERDAICAWLMTHHVPEVDGNLAEAMVNWGKIIYFTEAAFPKDKKETIIRYTAEELKWAGENEFALWKYLKDEKLLFKIDDRDKNNLLSPGPFSIGLPEKGPDRLGQYLGWRMIKKFMEKNDVSLQTLKDTPYTKILQAYEID